MKPYYVEFSPITGKWYNTGQELERELARKIKNTPKAIKRYKAKLEAMPNRFEGKK